MASAEAEIRINPVHTEEIAVTQKSAWDNMYPNMSKEIREAQHAKIDGILWSAAVQEEIDADPTGLFPVPNESVPEQTNSSTTIIPDAGSRYAL